MRLAVIGLILTLLGAPFFALYLRAKRWAGLYNTVMTLQPQRA
jgi:hypothetical protein